MLPLALLCEARLDKHVLTHIQIINYATTIMLENKNIGIFGYQSLDQNMKKKMIYLINLSHILPKN